MHVYSNINHKAKVIGAFILCSGLDNFGDLASIYSTMTCLTPSTVTHVCDPAVAVVSVFWFFTVCSFFPFFALCLSVSLQTCSSSESAHLPAITTAVQDGNQRRIFVPFIVCRFAMLYLYL